MSYVNVCVECGKDRFSRQEVAEGVSITSRNAYCEFLDKGKKRYLVVGLCKECFDKGDNDLDLIKQNVYNYERALCEKTGKPLKILEKIEGISLLSCQKKAPGKEKKDKVKDKKQIS